MDEKDLDRILNEQSAKKSKPNSKKQTIIIDKPIVSSKGNFFKSLIALIIQILIPSLFILGMFFFMYYIGVVSYKSDNIALLLLWLLSFIVVIFIIPVISSLLTSGLTNGIFLSADKISYEIKYEGNDTFTIKEKSADGTFGLVLNAILGVLISLVGLIIFIIGFFRLIISTNFREMYAMKLNEFKKEFSESKITWLLIIIIPILYFSSIAAFGLKIQKQYNIDIFSHFRPSVENQINHVEPLLNVTNMQVYHGGSYINGYIVEITTNITYLGELEISSIEGELNIYNSTNILLLTADCYISDLSSSSNKTLLIECRNTDKIEELSNYNLEDVSIYFRLNEVYYKNYTSKEYSSEYKVN